MDATGESRFPFAAEIESVGGDPRTFTIAGSGQLPRRLHSSLSSGSRSRRTRGTRCGYVRSTQPWSPIIRRSGRRRCTEWSDERREPGEAAPGMLVFTPTDPIAAPVHCSIRRPRNLTDRFRCPRIELGARRRSCGLPRRHRVRQGLHQPGCGIPHARCGFVPPETYDDNGPVGTLLVRDALQI